MSSCGENSTNESKVTFFTTAYFHYCQRFLLGLVKKSARAEIRQGGKKSARAEIRQGGRNPPGRQKSAREARNPPGRQKVARAAEIRQGGRNPPGQKSARATRNPPGRQEIRPGGKKSAREAEFLDMGKFQEYCLFVCLFDISYLWAATLTTKVVTWANSPQK